MLVNYHYDTDPDDQATYRNGDKIGLSDENELELWNVEFERLKKLKTLRIGLYSSF